MNNKITASITAVGGYVPDYVLSNKELESIVDTTDEWIQSRTGIKERRILKGKGKGTSDMCVEAINEILIKKKLRPEEIELIIVATITPDHAFPSTANVVCDKIGAVNAWGYDISAACSGFLFAIATAAQFIETGRYKKVVVVGADKMSSIINYSDRTTCIIFGDGAGAVLMEPNSEGYGIQDFVLKSDGSGRDSLCIQTGSGKHLTARSIANNEHLLVQEGQPVFKAAVTGMADVAEEIMKKNNLSHTDIAWLVPHQANKRIIDATAERIAVGSEKIMMNIENYGNTTGATIPLLLWDYEKKLKKGDKLIAAAFGGGFTWGAVYLTWSYDI